MVKLQYRIKTGRKLDLKPPVRYTEKIQWYKLYYREELMWRCADKLSMRDYIKEIGFGYLLPQIYETYDDVDTINLTKLPNEFVLKSSTGGGGREIIICTDKNKFDLEDAKQKMKYWLHSKKKNSGREWVYDGHCPKIIAEKLLKGEPELIDYKFYCFSGKCKLIHVAYDRTLGKDVRIAFFDRDFSPINVTVDCERAALKENLPQKPKNFEKMVEYAENLSRPFPHVRIDLYNIQGETILGELTFFNMSGYMNFIPDSFDFELGKAFTLPEEKFAGRDTNRLICVIVIIYKYCYFGDKNNIVYTSQLRGAV